MQQTEPGCHAHVTASCTTSSTQRPALSSIISPMPATTASTTATTRTGLRVETLSIKTCIANQHDWSDPHLQHRLATYNGTSGKLELLATVLEKITAPIGSSFTNYWAQQATWNGYNKLASIVACSSYARSEDLVHCGDGTFSCQDRLFCPRCCHNKLARRVDDEFGNSFGADSEVHYIVLSLSRDPDETNRLKVTDIGEDELHVLKHRVVSAQHGTVDGALDYGVGFDGFNELLQCRLLWYFMAEAIQEFTGGQRGSLFNGAFGGPELAVQFSPLRALPHANYLCWSPGFSIDGARELRRFIRTKMRDCRLIESGLYPSVACYRLRTADDLRRVVNYIFKPIDLAAAYVRAAELVDYVPGDMACLNLEVNKFLKNAGDVFWNVRRVARYGRCHASHHDYIGSVSAYRLAQREAAAERRAGGGDRAHRAGSDLDPVARWELHFDEQFERPVWPRASRYQLWRQLNHEQVSPAPWPNT